MQSKNISSHSSTTATSTGVNLNNKKIIRLTKVIEKTGLSRSTIYALILRNEFPQRIKLSTLAMGFLESEVDAWIEAKVANRDA